MAARVRLSSHCNKLYTIAIAPSAPPIGAADQACRLICRHSRLNIAHRRHRVNNSPFASLPNPLRRASRLSESSPIHTHPHPHIPTAVRIHTSRISAVDHHRIIAIDFCGALHRTGPLPSRLTSLRDHDQGQHHHHLQSPSHSAFRLSKHFSSPDSFASAPSHHY